jgi:predicted MarR family transcription regulator
MMNRKENQMSYESALDNARLARANEKAVAYEKAASDMIAYEKAQRWLGQCAEVVAFAQASGPQGGAGALIVLLTG